MTGLYVPLSSMPFSNSRPMDDGSRLTKTLSLISSAFQRTTA
jgi:hypothetical protein